MIKAKIFRISNSTKTFITLGSLKMKMNYIFFTFNFDNVPFQARNAVVNQNSSMFSVVKLTRLNIEMLPQSQLVLVLRYHVSHKLTNPPSTLTFCANAIKAKKCRSTFGRGHC